MRIHSNLGRMDRSGTGLNSALGLWEREFGSVPTIDQLYEPIEVRVTVSLVRPSLCVEAQSKR